MKYRDHRGSLKQSMKTVIEVSSIDDIINHLNSVSFYKKVVKIKFEYACYDERIGWNTYYVLAKYKGERGFKVAGMADGKLTKRSYISQSKADTKQRIGEKDRIAIKSTSAYQYPV